MSIAEPILIDLPNQLAGARVLARHYRDDDAAALHATIEVSRDHLRRWRWQAPKVKYGEYGMRLCGEGLGGRLEEAF